jgi:multiple sugar transport system permease protein
MSVVSMGRRTRVGIGALMPRRARPALVGYLFLLPLLAFLLVYQADPILRVLWLSFTNFRYLYPDGTRFVGLAQYIRAVQDPILWQGLAQAAEFTAIFIPGGVLFPVFLAILLDRVRNGTISGVYRSLLYIPALIPGPLVFVLWSWIYNPSQGLLNWLLIDGLHVASYSHPPLWLGNDVLFIPCIAVMEWWWGLGYHTIFFSVGLSTISSELYEAARIDGAKEWQIALRITLPLLKPMLLIMLVLRLSTAMGVLVEYLILGHDTFHPWTVYMYNLAFLNAQPMGYASAIGWIGTLVMLVVALGMYYFLRPEREAR